MFSLCRVYNINHWDTSIVELHLKYRLDKSFILHSINHLSDVILSDSHRRKNRTKILLYILQTVHIKGYLSSNSSRDNFQDESYYVAV